MVHLNKLTLTTIASLCLAAALPASEAPAQQRLVFKVAAENTKYTQQHEIDVGDVSGHQVRLFEIHRTYPSNPPAIGSTANPGTGLNETQVDIQYWLPQ